MASSTSSTLTNALQPQYAPAPPEAAVAQTDVPTGLTSSQLQQLSPDATIQQILAAYAPAAQQSQQNLNQSLAAAGVSGGGQVGATQQLQGQLAAGLAPSLSSAIQGAQSNVLGAEELGSNQGLQQALANAAALNTGNEYNTSNLINAESGNVSTANNFEQYLAGLQNTDWQSLLGAFTGLNEAGLSGQQGINQAAATTYPLQTGNGLGSLTSAVGNLYGYSQPASVSPISNPLSGSYSYNPYGADVGGD
jgi:hypothetical protein